MRLASQRRISELSSASVPPNTPVSNIVLTLNLNLTNSNMPNTRNSFSISDLNNNSVHKKLNASKCENSTCDASFTYQLSPNIENIDVDISKSEAQAETTFTSERRMSGTKSSEYNTVVSKIEDVQKVNHFK